MDPEDDDLTSLTWLHTCAGLQLPPPPSMTAPAPELETEEKHIKKKELKKPTLVMEEVSEPKLIVLPRKDLDLNLDVTKKVLVHQRTDVQKLVDHHKEMMKRIDFRNDSEARPPYSYATLICLAFMDRKKKMTLNQIYAWIKDNFAYFRNDKSISWKNSVRHNLSLNKFFLKIIRKDDDPGKGGYWILSPEYKRRRSSLDLSLSTKTLIPFPRQKRAQMNLEPDKNEPVTHHLPVSNLLSSLQPFIPAPFIQSTSSLLEPSNDLRLPKVVNLIHRNEISFSLDATPAIQSALRHFRTLFKEQEERERSINPEKEVTEHLPLRVTSPIEMIPDEKPDMVDFEAETVKPLPSASTLLKRKYHQFCPPTSPSQSLLCDPLLSSQSSKCWEDSGVNFEPSMTLPSLDHPLGFEGLMDLDNFPFGM